MLKVKDSVNLKELEKYGFTYGILYLLGRAYCKQKDGVLISIMPDNKIIEIEFNDYCGNDYEKDCEKEIDDLIKADLIEKVE